MPLLLVFLAAFFVMSPTYAQDALFTVPEVDPITRLLEPEKAVQMPQTGSAAVDLFLKNCTSQKHPTLDEEALLGQCLCTASRLEERFKPEQILGMFGNGRKAQVLRDQEVTRAFSPCMQDTIHDIALNECMGDSQIYAKVKNREPVCTCMAQGMRATLYQKEQWITGQYLQYDRDKAPDPLAYYMQSPALDEDMGYRFTVCMQWHEYGWQNRKR
ncbi:MAG: hypothetical protein LRY36_01140 [Alphaproteobacteria bacterium]|nr:hypothetical protein [Alphaproteobacteria bacterium]